MRRRMRIPKAPRNQATFAVIFARSAFGVRMRPRIAFPHRGFISRDRFWTRQIMAREFALLPKE